jgi:hypothetical protein
MTDQQLDKARRIKSIQREILGRLPIGDNLSPYDEITVLAGGIDIKKYNEWLEAQNDELQKQFEAL